MEELVSEVGWSPSAEAMLELRFIYSATVTDSGSRATFRPQLESYLFVRNRKTNHLGKSPIQLAVKRGGKLRNIVHQTVRPIAKTKQFRAPFRSSRYPLRVVYICIYEAETNNCTRNIRKNAFDAIFVNFLLSEISKQLVRRMSYDGGLPITSPGAGQASHSSFLDSNVRS